MNAEQCKFTMEYISEVTGLTLDAVRRHRRLGRFDLKDPKTTMKYTVAHMILKETESERR